MADRTVKYTFTGSFTNLTAGLTAASRSVQDFGSKLTELDRNGAKMRAGLEHFGRAGGRAAVVLGAGLAATAKAAVDWESAWAGVQKTVDGSTKDMAALEAGLRNLARTMPATHEEIAATAEAAGQLGVARDDIVDFTKVMLMLGETTNVSADEASTAIAQFMNVMGTSGDQVDEFGAALVDLGNKGASTEAEILALAQRLSGAGALVGASEQDILALASSMANLGVQAELGGGAIQRVFIGINTAVSDGGKKLDEFAKVAGVSAQDFATAWQQSPVEAFDLLLQGLNGVQESGGNVTGVLEDLGIKGTQNLQVMLRLAGAGDMLTNSLDQSRAAWEDNTALTTEYGKRAETTAAEVRVAWNNIKDAAIETGAALLPVVSKGAEGVAQLAQAFAGLPGPVKSATTGLAGLVAIFGGGLWFTSKVVSGIADTKQALANLGIEANKGRAAMVKLGAAASGLAAAAVGANALNDALDQLFDRRIDDSSLSRELEALARGEVVGNLKNLSHDLVATTSGLSDGLNELATGFGVLGDTDMDKAASNLSKVDDALASMVEGGQAERAATIFEEVLAIARESGVSAGDAAAQFDQYALALDNVNAAAGRASIREFVLGVASTAGAADSAAGATEKYAGATDSAGDAARAAQKELNGLVRAMREQTAAAGGAFDAMTNWGQAVADARAQARSGEKGLDALTEAGRNNRNALSALKDAWNNQPASVKNSVDAYRNARKTFIDVAESMGVSEQKAKRLADRLLEVPRKTLAEFTEKGADNTISKAQAVRAAIAGIERNVEVTVGFKQIGSVGSIVSGKFGFSADGSTVPDDGRGYSDRFLYALAPREEVVSNRRGQADAFRGELKDINAGLTRQQVFNRMLVRGLANGGTAGGWTGSVMGMPGESVFGSFADTMRFWTREMRRELREQVREAEKRRDALKKELEAVRDHRDALRDAARSLRDSIADQFRGTDLFGAEGASFDSIFDGLKQAKRDADTFAFFAAQLKEMGLDGAALQAVLQMGDLALLQDFAGQSPEQLQAFEDQFNLTQGGALQAGNLAANAVMGEQLAAANAELAAVRDEFREANRRWARMEKRWERMEELARKNPKETGKEVGQVVAGAAAAGAKGLAPS